VTRHDCDQIIRKFPNYHEYLELPEYNDLVSLLEKGIGIHHSGMLPILREIVEIMISKKRIKLLFATESFAIGLDCPIKTAIFTSLEKFDGGGLRPLLAHEYTQMAGRAGRRGIDTVGHVIHCNNLFSSPSIAQYKTILSGTPQKLVSKFKINYSTILNLLKTGCNRGFDAFPKKSMLMNELHKSSATLQKEIAELQMKIAKKTEMLEAMTVPKEICANYMEKIKTLSMVPHKKRKIVEREIADAKDMYKRIDLESAFYKEFDELKTEWRAKQSEWENLDQYMTIQVDKICDIMMKEGFVAEYEDGGIDSIKEETKEGTKSYQLTVLGKMAMNVAEIHPLIISRLMDKWNYMTNLSIPQIVGLFSCFTDIKVPDEQKTIVPKSRDSQLLSYIESLETEYRHYETMELDYALYTGIEYTLMFDMVDHMMEWCDCSLETDCKGFIQRMKMERGVSIGDFTKAVLKIVTIARELSAMCVYSEQVEFQYKMTQIEPMVLKYITIAQSLYV
jgi:replicative superfamily II helicase